MRTALRCAPGVLQGAALCVDATHPYATEATRNIRAAAAAAGVEYHRLLRPASNLPVGSVVLPGAAQAAAYLADRPGRILLATGAKELPAFAALDPQRLYPRIAYLVTKDGGAAGGFAEKAEAAAQCGVQLVVLRRPEEQGESAETILQRCKELL